MRATNVHGGYTDTAGNSKRTAPLRCSESRSTQYNSMTYRPGKVVCPSSLTNDRQQPTKLGSRSHRMFIVAKHIQSTGRLSLPGRNRSRFWRSRSMGRLLWKAAVSGAALPSAVPEPATVVLPIFASVGVFIRRNCAPLRGPNLVCAWDIATNRRCDTRFLKHEKRAEKRRLG